MRIFLKQFFRNNFPQTFRTFMQKRLVSKRLPKYFVHDLSRLNHQHTVIDLGANIGNITEILAKTGARVIAFEPSSKAFEQLKQYTSKYPNVTILKKAAGVQSKKVKLFLNKKTNQEPNTDLTQSSSLFEEKPNVSVDIFDEVEEINFSDYLISLNTTIEILKVDIEGYEIPLINHLIDTKAIYNVNKIYVETHEDQFPGLLEDTIKLKTRVKELGIENMFKFDWH